MKNLLTAVLLSLTSAPLTAACMAAAPQPATEVMLLQDGDRPDLKHLNLDKSGLAIKGYDPVSYFPEGGSKPRKGKSELAFKDRGVTYRFATKENLELFKKSPAKFEPHYGGWCAFAMADGAKVEVDPKSYVIQGGRLMLFYKSFFNDTRKKWNKKSAELEAKANKAWGEIVEPPK